MPTGCRRGWPDLVVSHAEVAVLAVHPPRTAATRLRTEQYRPALEASGITTRTWSFFRDRDLAAWFGPSHPRRAWVALVALARLPLVVPVVRGTRVVIVQREAMPFGPPIIELLATRGRRLVWDVDDAIWEPFASPTSGRVPQWIRATGRKYERICAAADEVWAGSGVLAAWCRRFSDAVEVVPTVVEVPDQRPARRAERSVGWIGSHSTVGFLDGVLPAVAAVPTPPSVVIVGGTPQVPAALSARVSPWSPAAETDALERIRVGLYPVDRAHALAEGKCGLKAILYMAHGIPPIVTPTTTNAEVVGDGVHGLHAESPEEWTSAVQRLLDDDELWERCSRAGHERARASYSLEAWAPKIVERLRRLLGEP